MIVTRPRAEEVAPREPSYIELNASLYAPVAGCILLAVVLWLLGWPTAGAFVAGLGLVYAPVWLAVAALEQWRRR